MEAETLTGKSIAVCCVGKIGELPPSSLAQDLGNLGGRAWLAPLLTAAPPPDGFEQLDRSLATLSEFEWVAFTSANGVAVTLERMKRLRIKPAESPSIAVVGPATAAAAIRAGLSVTLEASHSTAAGLAGAFPDPVLSNDSATARPVVLAPLAVMASDHLVDGLTDRGYHAHRVDAYGIVPQPVTTDDLNDLVTSDAIVVTSPSVVRRLVQLTKDRSEWLSTTPPVVCIGPTTFAQAQKCGFKRLVVAKTQDTNGLISAVGVAVAQLDQPDSVL